MSLVQQIYYLWKCKEFKKICRNFNKIINIWTKYKQLMNLQNVQKKTLIDFWSKNYFLKKIWRDSEIIKNVDEMIKISTKLKKK